MVLKPSFGLAGFAAGLGADASAARGASGAAIFGAGLETLAGDWGVAFFCVTVFCSLVSRGCITGWEAGLGSGAVVATSVGGEKVCGRAETGRAWTSPRTLVDSTGFRFVVALTVLLSLIAFWVGVVDISTRDAALVRF